MLTTIFSGFVRALFLTLAILGGQLAHANEAQAAGNAAADVASATVLVKTTHGEFTLELFPDLAPVTVANFLSYVDAGFYNGLIFHRVIPDFMIQGGGFEPDLSKRKTRDPIKNEADNGLLNGRGTIAMARTRAINSATAQFFINLKHNTFLNHGARDFGYAVFGKVLSGMDVIDRIAGISTRRAGPHQNFPTTPVVIQSMQRAN